MRKLNSHPSFEEIYKEIHQKHPLISKTTVYRNLHLLAANGIIRPVSLQDGLERYDARTGRHDHFKCRECGQILDVDLEYRDDMDETVHKQYGIQVDGHDVIFTGMCADCGNTII